MDWEFLWYKENGLCRKIKPNMCLDEMNHHETDIKRKYR